ncbi:Uncharacterised protein [Chlamydia trachomatis]|nr:Uncharacterised protein [Chlamydia trachomatis]
MTPKASTCSEANLSGSCICICVCASHKRLFNKWICSCNSSEFRASSNSGSINCEFLSCIIAINDSFSVDTVESNAAPPPPKENEATFLLNSLGIGDAEGLFTAALSLSPSKFGKSLRGSIMEYPNLSLI